MADIKSARFSSCAFGVGLLAEAATEGSDAALSLLMSSLLAIVPLAVEIG